MSEAATISMNQYKELERQKAALRKQLIGAYDIGMISKQPPKNAQAPSTIEVLAPVVSDAFDVLEAADQVGVLKDLDTVERDGDHLRLYVPFESRSSKHLVGAFLIAWGRYTDRTGKPGFSLDLVDRKGTILFTTQTK